MRRKTLIVWILAGLAGLGQIGREASGELILWDPDEPAVVDFAGYLGLGFSPSAQNGQLDSTTFRVGGFSDGTLAYGDSATSGDFARGQSIGGERTGGLYAFEVAEGDYALGAQPTSGDFTPGFFELRILNQTGAVVPTWQFEYDVFFRNDSPRASAWNLAYSIDGSDFTHLPSFDFTTPGTADSTSFESAFRSGTVPVSVPNGGNLHFRWTSDDYAGTGARDEIGVDNIRVSGAGISTVPEPSSLAFMSVASLVLFATWRLRERRRRG